MARICPNCSHELRAESTSGVILDVCPRCAGIWFDEGELRTLMDRSPAKVGALEDAIVPDGAPVPPREGKPVRKCPNTGTLLQAFHYMYDSPIVLDECPDCGGVWVDDGELAKMLDWLIQSRAPLSADEKKRVATARLEAEAQESLNRQNALIAFMKRLNRPSSVWPI